MKLYRKLPVLLFISLCFLLTLGYVSSTAEDTGIPIDGDPHSLAINPNTDQAVIGSLKPNGISVVDLDTEQVISTIGAGKKPLGVAIDSTRDLALVAQKSSDKLSIVSLDTHQLLANISVGKSPSSVAVYERDSGPHLGLTANCKDNTVSVVELNQFVVLQTIPVGQQPRDLAVDSNLGLALVVNEKDDTVSVIDLRSFQVIRLIPVGNKPQSISINSETHLAAIANTKGNCISIINLTRWQTQTIPVDKKPVDLAVNPLDNTVLVVCEKTQSLLRIDLNTNTILQEYPLNKKTRGVAVNPFTNIAAVVAGQTDSLTQIQLPNPMPGIESVSPMRIARGSLGTTLTIQGSGFLKTSTVSVQPSPDVFPVTFIDNRHLSIPLPQGFLAKAGTWQVRVDNTAPEGGISNSSFLTVLNPVPAITTIDSASTPDGGLGLTLTVYGTGFFPETTISVNGETRSGTYISGTEFRVTLVSQDIASAGNLSITASNPAPGGGTSNTMTFTIINPVPILSSINPNTIQAGSSAFTTTLTGSNFVAGSSILFNSMSVTVTYVDSAHLTASIPSSAVLGKGTYPVVVTNPGPGGGTSGFLNFTVTPSSNVTPLPEGAYGKKYEDLFPPDATIINYDSKRFSLITGLVNDANGSPLSEVMVGIHSHPEYGTAQTDPTGRFSIPLDGGGTTTVTYRKAGFLTVHRQVNISWNTIANAETIVMIPEDTKTTVMAFNSDPQTILIHHSSQTMDSIPPRSLTMVFTGDNRALVKDAQGVEQPQTNITVRATEYPTPESMPAKLPPTSAFTYCAELTVDGAKSVRFEKPVVVYVNNFLGFNVGEIVPVGYYDRDRAVWAPANNGVVVQLLDTNDDGVVDAYTDGINQYPAPGLTDSNQYHPNATYWRVELDHFSPWDFNWPYGFPEDAIAPNPEGEPVQDTQCPNDDNTCINSYVENRSRIFHEDIPVQGTDLTLHYASNRVKGYKSVITIPASGSSVPGSLTNIIVKMEVAGRVFQTVLPARANQMAEFIWDGFDYLGKQIFGSTIANISIGFVYHGVYYSSRAVFLQSFAQAGDYLTGIRSRQEVISWKYQTITIHRGETGILAEGWNLSSHHYMDSSDPTVLYKGNGTTVKKKVPIISSISGDGMIFSCIEHLTVDSVGNIYMSDRCNNRILKLDRNGNFIKTINLYSPRGIAEDGAGNIYIVTGYNQIMKVDPAGNIIAFAGNGQAGYSGDGGSATQASLNHPNGVTIDNAGNVYIADSDNYRVRKVDPTGIISTIAGNGQRGYSGDQGPAAEADIGLLHSVAVDYSGNIYFNDNDNHRIRKVDATGIITTIAGNGQASYSGDGGPAVQATLFYPVGVSVDKGGNVYISDGSNYRLRKVDTGGIITTLAGNGQYWTSGDGGPATPGRSWGAP